MPAIPTLARLEAHLSDAALVALHHFLDSLLGDGHRPGGLLTDGKVMDDEQARAVREALDEIHAAARRAIRERHLGADA